MRVVIVEVHNTHGERRLYTLRPQQQGKGWVDEMDKDFYVSPFIDMEAHYTVRVQDDPGSPPHRHHRDRAGRAAAVRRPWWPSDDD